MRKLTVANSIICVCLFSVLACDSAEEGRCHVNGVLEKGEDCDGSLFNNLTCKDFDASRPAGELLCTSECTISLDNCREPDPVICSDGKVTGDEDCDGENFGNKTCKDVDSAKPYGRLNCTNDCKFDTTWCFANDVGLQAEMPQAESNNAICSNGENDYNTVDKQGNISQWFDCKNHWCTQLPIVSVCETLENTNELCSNARDDAMTPRGRQISGNDLVDCADPSCFKNPTVTVCHATASVAWELGADCSDKIDNDGDTLVDCEDPDCLHAGGSCPLGEYKRILFDNAHHQMAGNADWIIDVTGRHPYPSIPQKEDDWHGQLSSWGKALMDTKHFVLETLPQDRVFSYGTDAVQDLKHYDLLISTEPSLNYSESEIEAVHEFVKNGGAFMIIADHAGADRDGNNWDCVQVINDMSEKLSAKHGNNPFGFTALTNTSMATLAAMPHENAVEHAIIKGTHGEVKSVASYAGTAFALDDGSSIETILSVKGQAYAIAGKIGKGRFFAIGDSSIAGDNTDSLGIKSGNSGFDDAGYDNKVLLMNAVEWLVSR
ncbi:MAG: hypothetical protein ACOX8U_02660 [Bradymonadia bacterium]|jgi:hypothetical protein